ncbi:MAG: hypothetical protein R2745_18230 [Vicinamibacterales bacterium]
MSDPAPSPAPSHPVVVTPVELFWLTAGLWVSGICLLALLPVVLMPRVGPAAGLAVSYVTFFVAWQPLQRITQRAVGPSRTFIRMLALVASAAMLAYYIREALLAAVRTGAS